MTFRRFPLAVAMVAAFFVLPASAQVTAESFKNAAGQVQDGQGVTIIAPIRGMSATASGAVAVANTYQSALAANPARKGCAIYNTSANAELIYLGAPGGATAATSIPLPAGGSFNCGSFQGIVLTDQISITSSIVPSTFVVVSQ